MVWANILASTFQRIIGIERASLGHLAVEQWRAQVEWGSSNCDHQWMLGCRGCGRPQVWIQPRMSKSRPACDFSTVLVSRYVYSPKMMTDLAVILRQSAFYSHRDCAGWLTKVKMLQVIGWKNRENLQQCLKTTNLWKEFFTSICM